MAALADTAGAPGVTSSVGMAEDSGSGGSATSSSVGGTAVATGFSGTGESAMSGGCCSTSSRSLAELAHVRVMAMKNEK